jgi:hypothetical protein
MARPQIQIDWQKFDLLCALQCSLSEIACEFDCSEDTIERAVKREHKISFAEYFALKRGKGKISLRRKQYQKAMDGDTTMLIFLGKQWLGQADKQSTELTGKDGQPIQTEDVTPLTREERQRRIDELIAKRGT